MRPEIEKLIINSHEKQVKLDNMKIQDNEIEDIAKTIKMKRPNVQSILLSRNNIGDLGAAALADELSLLPELSSIDLQFNDLGATGIKKLLILKISHPDIQIALHGNKIQSVTEMQQIEDEVLNSNNSLKR